MLFDDDQIFVQKYNKDLEMTITWYSACRAYKTLEETYYITEEYIATHNSHKMSH